MVEVGDVFLPFLVGILGEDKDIFPLHWVIWGLEGSALRRESHLDMRAAISGVMWGIKFFLKPAGMLCLEAVIRV